MEYQTLLTINDVARIFQVSKQAIRHWTNSGRLACVRTPGGHRRFRRSDIERILEVGEDERKTVDN